MISRSGMGKQLTGNRTKKMAAGGKASASKSSASKGAAKPAAKSGGSAAGKTINTSSTRKNEGGGGMFSGIRNAVSNALSGGKKLNAVTDPKTGQSYAKPTYGGMSLKGLTSSDPANVARNRAAAANYAAMEAARTRGADMRSDRTSAAPTPTVTPTTPAPVAPVAPVAPKMVYTPPPAGYRPGIDPEHRFYQPAPTVTMKKGGRVKPKRAK
jgi:hypothetical protein